MTRALIPCYVLDALTDITPSWMRAKGLLGLAMDLDNTMAGYGEATPVPAIRDWLALMRASGFGLVVLTNNNRARAKTFCKPLSLPFISKAKKPRRKAFDKAASLLGIPLRKLGMAGDQIFTDVWGGNRAGMTTILVKPVRLQGHTLLRLRSLLERPFVRAAIHSADKERHKDD